MKKKWGSDEKQTITFLVVPSLTIPNSHGLKVSGSNNKGIQLSLELENQSYKRGESITGVAKMLDPNKKVRSLSFLLISTEKAGAQGQSESVSKEHEQKLNLEQDKDIGINLMIPHDSPFSYSGKLSEFSYVVDLKADIALSADVHAKSDITIT